MRAIALLVILTFTALRAQAQDASAPYIYYYDPLQQGLVVERADGTDSRVYQNVTDYRRYVQKPIWSASGKWFVTNNEVFSTDGSRSIQLPTVVNQWNRIKWAPQDDVLLVAGQDNRNRVDEFFLFDVETEEILAQLDLHPIMYPNEVPRFYVDWLPDGSMASVTWAGNIVMLYPDGRAMLRQANFQKSLTYAMAGGRTAALGWPNPPTTKLALIDVDQMRGIDLPNRQEYTVIRWSRTQDHVVVYAPTCTEGTCEYSAVIVDWETGTPTELESIKCACQMEWSHDGRYATFTQDGYTLEILDTLDYSIRPFPKPSNLQDSEWLPDGRLLFITDKLTPDFKRVVAFYDPVTDEVLPSPGEVTMIVLRIDASPDGELIGIPADHGAVIDRDGNIVVEASPHSANFNSRRVHNYYVWHLDSQWVIRTEYDFFAEPYSVVFDVNGTTERELPLNNWADFLPPQAVTHLPPSGQPSPNREPDFVVHRIAGLQTIAWHPTDKHRFMTYSDAGFIVWSWKDGSIEIIDTIVPLEAPLIVSDDDDSGKNLNMLWKPDEDVVVLQRERGEANKFTAVEFNLTTRRWSTRPAVKDPQFILIGETFHLVSPNGQGSKPLDAQTWPYLLTRTDTGFLIEGGTARVFIHAITGRVIRLWGERQPVSLKMVWDADVKAGLAVFGSHVGGGVIEVGNLNGRLLEIFHGTALDLALSPDGQWLATVSAGKISLWDMSEHVPTIWQRHPRLRIPW